MNINSAEAALWFEERDNFLILTHKRPDGDTIGSASGLCRGLREAGKTAWILPNPETTSTYECYISQFHMPEGFGFEHVVTVDTASAGLFQINAEKFAGEVALAIDHHPSNTGYASMSCVDSERAACGEVIFDILMALSGSVSRETATALYVALATDTGCFCYGNTNAKTHLVASQLIDAGVPNGRLNKELFRTKSKPRLNLEASIINDMEYYGEVGIAALSWAKRVELGVGEDDVEDIAAIPNQIEGVKIGITMQEKEDGTVKISVRTSDSGPSANEICQKLGGGGHRMAAGCSVEMSLETAKIQILKAIDEVWVK